MSERSTGGFDHLAHGRKAAVAYQQTRSRYESYANAVREILQQALDKRCVKVASIEPRAKSIESFERKAASQSAEDPQKPKYTSPLNQITDLAGIRVITFFPKTIEEVGAVIAAQFTIREKSDKSITLEQEDRLGYKSVHYLVELKADRCSLPEYEQYKSMVAEIQVRTILQHAWAEIEHDIRYKSLETAPSIIRRRFITLAGLLDVADREFQAIQDEDERLREAARTSVLQGKLEHVEITPDALKAYLDNHFGIDRRVAPSWYQAFAEELRWMGFVNFSQIDECIAEYEQDKVSKIVWGYRQGQNWRFQTVLMAGMGDNWFRFGSQRHKPPWVKVWDHAREKLTLANIVVGQYSPRQ